MADGGAKGEKCTIQGFILPFFDNPEPSKAIALKIKQGSHEVL
jgi:hypothetical protein